MLKIYHNPRCSKSRQGLALLESSGEAFEVIKYLENPPTKKELKDILKLLRFSAIDLIRKNEAIWKEKYRDRSLTEDELIDAMIAYPKLIERPIVIKGDQAVIGRPIEKIGTLLD